MKYLIKASVFFEVEADSYDDAMTQARVRVAEEDNTALDWEVEMIPIDITPVQDEWTGLPWDNPDVFCQLPTIPRGTPHWYDGDYEFCLGCAYQRKEGVAESD